MTVIVTVRGEAPAQLIRVFGNGLGKYICYFKSIVYRRNGNEKSKLSALRG